MAAPQQAQRSRWLDVCLAAAAGTALASGAYLYWRHCSAAVPCSDVVRSRARSVPPQAAAKAAADHSISAADAPAPEQVNRAAASAGASADHSADQQRCRHDSAYSVEASPLISWRRLSQQGAFASTITEGSDEHAASGNNSGGVHGGSSSGADAGSGTGGSSLAQGLSHRRPRVSTDSSVMLSEPEDGADGSPGAAAGTQAARGRSGVSPEAAGASFSDINLRDVRLYRDADGKPVLLGKGTYAKVLAVAGCKCCHKECKWRHALVGSVTRQPCAHEAQLDAYHGM